MAEALIYRREDLGTVFIWKGGSQIEVFWADSLVLAGAFGTPPRPFINIGVRDLATDKLMITTRAEFNARCEEWIADLDDGDLEKYVEESP